MLASPVAPVAGAETTDTWPLQDGFWMARKPLGGFRFLTVDQLLLPWHAYQHGLITPLALRGYLASQEMAARRCGLAPGTRGHYRAHELQELLGPAVRHSQAEAVIETLAESGLVTWTEHAVRLLTRPEDLQGVDLARYAALRAHVHPLLYRVPVPRRLLRYLAREGSPGLIATTLGVVLRCLRYFRRDQQCRSGGTLTAAWIARCFGIGERTAYRGLASLEALGWLATRPPPPTLRHPEGPWRVVNLAWEGLRPAPTPSRQGLADPALTPSRQRPPAVRLRARAAMRAQSPVQLELFPVVPVVASEARRRVPEQTWPQHPLHQCGNNRLHCALERPRRGLGREVRQDAHNVLCICSLFLNHNLM